MSMLQQPRDRKEARGERLLVPLTASLGGRRRVVRTTFGRRPAAAPGQTLQDPRRASPGHDATHDASARRNDHRNVRSAIHLRAWIDLAASGCAERRLSRPLGSSLAFLSHITACAFEALGLCRVAPPIFDAAASIYPRTRRRIGVNLSHKSCTINQLRVAPDARHRCPATGRASRAPARRACFALPITPRFFFARRLPLSENCS